MEAITKRIKELELPLHQMSDEQNILKLFHLFKIFLSRGIAAGNSMEMARQGLLWDLCYDIYSHVKLYKDGEQFDEALFKSHPSLTATSFVYN